MEPPAPMAPQPPRRAGVMDTPPPDYPLPVARAVVRALSYECPTCGAPYECDDMMLVEDDAGRFAPAGPDRFPVCAGCDVQFECESVWLQRGDGPRLRREPKAQTE